MGFLAGFGEGFANGMDRERRIKAAKEEQMFTAKFDAYMKRQEQTAQYEREAAKNVRKAKALVEGHNVPPDAWSEVYRWVRDGVDDSTIEKRLKTGSFVSTDSTPENPSMANTNSQTDEAMANERPDMAGGAPHEPDPAAEGAQFPEAPAAPNMDMSGQAAMTAPNGQPAGGAPTSPNSPAPMAGSKMEQRVNSRVAEAAGVSPDQVASTLGGQNLYPEPEIPESKLRFKPGAEEIEWPGGLGEINYKKLQAAKRGDRQAYEQYDAMEKSAIFAMNMDNMSKNPQGSQMYVFTDPKTGELVSKEGNMTPNGLMIAGPKGMELVPGITQENSRIVGDEEKKRWAELRKPNEVVSKLRARQTDVANMYKLGGEMLDIVEANPDALTGAAAASHLALEWSREADAVINMLKSDSPQASVKLEELNSQISKKILSKDIRDAGEARGLLEAKKKLAAYKLSQLENVRTGDASKFNTLRFEDIIGGDNDPVRFKTNLATILQGLESDVSVDANQINTYNEELNQLKEQYGYSPIKQITPSMKQFISGIEDPTIKKAYENLSQFRGHIPNVQQGGQPQKVAPQDTQLKEIPAPAIEALKQNVGKIPGLEAQFEQKYGLKPGEAKKYLQQGE